VTHSEFWFVIFSIVNKLLDCTAINREFVCFSIFILISRESDGGAILWTNPHPLTSCPFSSFPVISLTSYRFNLLLVRSHQSGIIIVKRLIQGRKSRT